MMSQFKQGKFRPNIDTFIRTNKRINNKMQRSRVKVKNMFKNQ